MEQYVKKPAAVQVCALNGATDIIQAPRKKSRRTSIRGGTISRRARLSL